ncbi:cyclin-dependent kinase inhibitor 5-like isoform X2 [Quercus lobata]|uniref:cyclin-dependent kinase inhibitor 5-like isoform X2 n=1 Tax=Quercus lobata TaxID=97700 RepID=UPI0012444F10|nr:cyclin-dependent kinase inhibitor 5-like isoform X2 [Quercus lobata]
MGKYMKKSKEGEVAVVMEVSSIGICTRRRAKSLLAAQKPKPKSKSDSSSLSYLQLRSRRLHKPPPLLLTTTTTPSSTKPKPHTISISNSTLFDSSSFGDNYLDFDASPRESSRESTPCSLIRDADSIGITPGSTTSRTSTETNRRVRNIPTTQEMEEFFARAEQEHQRIFIDKYNFDFVSDLPLPGRYEWVQIIP